MTLRHLKIFTNICNHGSTTKAAQELNLAQPAVSLALTELESYYGLKLFDRISNRLYITESGKQFLQHSEHIVSLFDMMEKGTRNWDTIGIMRFGTSVAIGNGILPNYVQAFKSKYPDMKLNITIDHTKKIEQGVLKNDLDFGLVGGMVNSEYIITRPFMEDILTFICPPDHPWASMEEICVNSLISEDFVLREKGSVVRKLLDTTLQAHGIEIKPTLQSISTHAIIRGVSSGMGVSMLPHQLVEEHIQRGEIATFKVKGISLTRNFSVIYHKDKYLSDAAKYFISSLFPPGENADFFRA